MTRRLRRVVPWLASGAVAAAFACGGATGSLGGGTGSDGGASGDGGTGGGTSPCPITPPGDGSDCGPQGLTCEWGGATVQDCDTLALCNGGRWQVTAPGPGGLDCKPGTLAMCPASFPSVPREAHCSPYGLYCDYAQGRCACTVPAGPGFPADASAVAEWLCQDPAAGCPQPRPLLGSVCSQEGLQCDYGACTIPGGNAETCQGGLWTEGGMACPAAAGG
jgi:hypothetical protein